MQRFLNIEIERAANRVNITIHTAKPGMVIGKGGAEVEALRQASHKIDRQESSHQHLRN